MPPASRRTEVETFQKGYVQPMYAISRPLSEATDMYDTEFEDLSDAEEYSGRRSEESVSGIRYFNRPAINGLLILLSVREAERHDNIFFR